MMVKRKRTCFRNSMFIYVSLICCVCGFERNLESEVRKVILDSKPEYVTGLIEDTVSFSCNLVNEKKAPISMTHELPFVWLKNGVVQFNNSVKSVQNCRLSLKERSLVIRHIKPEDAGKYRCQVFSSGEPWVEHELVVNYAPNVNAVESYVLTKCGEDVVVQCAVSGNPVPRIEWRFANHAFSGEISLDQSSLILKQVSSEQGGKYICIAENGIGEAANASVEVLVMSKPIVKVERKKIYVGERQPIHVTCAIEGFPNPSVMWLRNGVAMETSNRWIQSKEKKMYALDFKEVNERDLGTLTCRAVNCAGTTDGVIEIMRGTAKKVKFVSDSNGEEEESYKLSWIVESVTMVNEFLVMYRKVFINETKQWFGNWVNVSVLNDQRSVKENETFIFEETLVLKNLTGASQYEVLVQVVNAFGGNEASKFTFGTLGFRVSCASRNGMNVVLIVFLFFVLVLQ